MILILKKGKIPRQNCWVFKLRGKETKVGTIIDIGTEIVLKSGTVIREEGLLQRKEQCVCSTSSCDIESRIKAMFSKLVKS